MTQHQGEAKEGSVYPGLRVQSFQSTMVEQEKEEGKGEAEDMTIFGRFLIPPTPIAFVVLWILDIIQPLTWRKIMIITFLGNGLSRNNIS